MSNIPPVSSKTASLGGSENTVYQQFISDWSKVDSLVTTLRNNPHYQEHRTEIENLISQMYQTRQALPPIEQKDINGSVEQYITDSKPTMDKIQADYESGLVILNGSPGAQTIYHDYEQAKNDISTLANTISANQANLAALQAQEQTLSGKTIPQLQEAIPQISDPSKQAQAKSLLDTLISQDQTLKKDIASATNDINISVNNLNALTAPDSKVTGRLTYLSQLAQETNPSQEDVDMANADLANIENDPTYQQTLNSSAAFQQKHVAILNQDIAQIQKTVAAITALLPPAPDSRFEIYTDNWAIPDGGLPIPKIPTNVNIDYAFGEVAMAWVWDPNADNGRGGKGMWVVNQNDPSNGSWLANFEYGFPVDPSKIIGTLTSRMPDALAIGGWNASQPNPLFDPTNPATHYAYQENDLYQIMTSPNPQVRENFINNIVSTASQYGYKKIIMDYEDYSHGGKEGNNYTQFLEQLDGKLQALSPPVKLEIAISPDVKNQDYYNLKSLIANTNIIFEPMCYDYAAGVSPQIVAPNAGTGQTLEYLKAMVASGMPADRMKIGFSTYGQAFNLPPGTTLQNVLANMNSANGLSFASNWSGDCPVGTPNGGNGQISNDQIFKLLGGSAQNPWQPSAASGWQAIVYQDPNHPNYPPEVFYYNPTAGNNGAPLLISAQTSSDVRGLSTATGQQVTCPSAIDTLVKACDTDPALSGNLGFFGWDAMEDENSVTLNAVIASDSKYHK